MALPVFSVHSVQDAEDLRVLACRRTFPPNSRYVLNVESGFDGELETLELATNYLSRCYEAMLYSRINRGAEA